MVGCCRRAFCGCTGVFGSTDTGSCSARCRNEREASAPSRRFRRTSLTTLSQFAEYVGISQPNATYKVNALAGKGYVEKVVSKPDRREIRLRTGKKFAQYFDEDRPAICAAAERVRAQFSESEIDTARRVLDALLDAMQEGTKGANV